MLSSPHWGRVTRKLARRLSNPGRWSALCLRSRISMLVFVMMKANKKSSGKQKRFMWTMFTARHACTVRLRQV